MSAPTTTLAGRPWTPSPAGQSPAPGARVRPGLPGLATADRPAGVLPRTLLAPGSLLLAEVAPGRRVGLREHLGRWGSAVTCTADDLVHLAARAEVVGAGGAGFPTARKIASLADGPVSMVIVNGAEGESASGKDSVLLAHVPHLVLDGAVAAARALGAPRVVVRIAADRPDLAQLLPAVIAERADRLPIQLSVGPDSFVAGEASAVIRSVTGGPALPAALGRPPTVRGRLPWQRSGVLLSNVETFARLAVAARGSAEQSALVSVSGAVGTPGVLELPPGTTLAGAGAWAGGVLGAPRVLITGGWHGRWVPWDERVARSALTRASLADVGGRWGAGALVWVPEDLDPWVALAAVAAELAEGTAGQCGPCWRGLPEVASLIVQVAVGARDRSAAESVMDQVDGRGICAHPSASVAALRSALDLIGTLR